MKTTTTSLVFVRLYIMLGDADGSIEGYKVMPLTEWEENVAMFKAYLKAKKIFAVYKEGDLGGYDVNLKNYKVKPITAKEAAVIKKFLGVSPGSFRLPTDFI